MQHNPGCKTIEGELGKAMNKAGAISNENAGEFSKVQGGLLSPSLSFANAGLRLDVLLSTRLISSALLAERSYWLTGTLESGGSHRQGSQRSRQRGLA